MTLMTLSVPNFLIRRYKALGSASVARAPRLWPGQGFFFVQSSSPFKANNSSMTSVDLLILGAGWTSSFLIPLCNKRGITFAATTRSGRDETIRWEFDPEVVGDEETYRALPDASAVLITFPITLKGASERLVRNYLSTRKTSDDRPRTQFIQLGSTSVWDVSLSLIPMRA